MSYRYSPLRTNPSPCRPSTVVITASLVICFALSLTSFIVVLTKPSEPIFDEAVIQQLDVAYINGFIMSNETVDGKKLREVNFKGSKISSVNKLEVGNLIANDTSSSSARFDILDAKLLDSLNGSFAGLAANDSQFDFARIVQAEITKMRLEILELKNMTVDSVNASNIITGNIVAGSINIVNMTLDDVDTEAITSREIKSEQAYFDSANITKLNATEFVSKMFNVTELFGHSGVFFHINASHSFITVVDTAVINAATSYVQDASIVNLDTQKFTSLNASVTDFVAFTGNVTNLKSGSIYTETFKTHQGEADIFEVRNMTVGTLKAESILIDDITFEDVITNSIDTQSLNTRNLTSDAANFTDAKMFNCRIETANVGDLASGTITTEHLYSMLGSFQNFTATNTTGKRASFESLDVDDAKIRTLQNGNLTSSTAVIEDARISTAIVNDATLGNVTFANMAGQSLESGSLKTSTLDSGSANIQTVSVVEIVGATATFTNLTLVNMNSESTTTKAFNAISFASDNATVGNLIAQTTTVEYSRVNNASVDNLSASSARIESADIFNASIGKIQSTEVHSENGTFINLRVSGFNAIDIKSTNASFTDTRTESIKASTASLDTVDIGTASANTLTVINENATNFTAQNATVYYARITEGVLEKATIGVLDTNSATSQNFTARSLKADSVETIDLVSGTIEGDTASISRADFTVASTVNFTASNAVLGDVQSESARTVDFSATNTVTGHFRALEGNIENGNITTLLAFDVTGTNGYFNSMQVNNLQVNVLNINNITQTNSLQSDYVNSPDISSENFVTTTFTANQGIILELDAHSSKGTNLNYTKITAVDIKAQSINIENVTLDNANTYALHSTIVDTRSVISDEATIGTTNTTTANIGTANVVNTFGTNGAFDKLTVGNIQVDHNVTAINVTTEDLYSKNIKVEYDISTSGISASRGYFNFIEPNGGVYVGFGGWPIVDISEVQADAAAITHALQAESVSSQTMSALYQIETPKLTSENGTIDFDMNKLENVRSLSIVDSTIDAIASKTNIFLDAYPRFEMNLDGQMSFGDGSNPKDVWWYRNTANSLALSTTSRGTPNAMLELGSLKAYGSVSVPSITTSGTTIGFDGKNVNDINRMTATSCNVQNSTVGRLDATTAEINSATIAVLQSTTFSASDATVSNALSSPLINTDNIIVSQNVTTTNITARDANFNGVFVNATLESKDTKTDSLAVGIVNPISGTYVDFGGNDIKTTSTVIAATVSVNGITSPGTSIDLNYKDMTNLKSVGADAVFTPLINTSRAIVSGIAARDSSNKIDFNAAEIFNVRLTSSLLLVGTISRINNYGSISMGNSPVTGIAYGEIDTLKISRIGSLYAIPNQIDFTLTPLRNISSLQTQTITSDGTGIDFDAKNINNAAIVTATSVSTASITTTGTGISFNSKDISAVNSAFINTLSTPTITTSGTTIGFNSKNVNDINDLYASAVYTAKIAPSASSIDFSAASITNVGSLTLNTLTAQNINGNIGTPINFGSSDISNVASLTVGTRVSSPKWTSPNSNHDFDNKGMTNIGTITTSTLNTDSIGVRYGSSTYYKLPIVFYNVRTTLTMGSGTNQVASITIPADFMSTTGDAFILTIMGNGYSASGARSIGVSVNGATTESYSLTPGMGNIWKIELKIQRATATSVDVIGTGHHEKNSLTIGNVGRTCTSFGSTGSIVITTTSATGGDIIVRNIDLVFYPGT